MYFVNTKLKQQCLTSIQKQKKLSQVQSILFIPKYQRKDSEKRLLFEYFLNNSILKDIQRSKSLKARILCVGQLQIITQIQYLENVFSAQQFQKNNGKFILIQKIIDDSTLVVLRKQIKQQILKQSQQSVSPQMLQLKKFSFLKVFQYHEQLYLAHFIQKINQIRYKQFVFKQNQPAQHIYFIEQGQFQVFKNLQFIKKKRSTNKIALNKQLVILKNYLELQESPYKKKQFKIIKQELAKIQGVGQCFGEIQLFLQKQNRLYSLKCNSLNSKLFRIPFKKFEQILKQNPYRLRLLKKQYVQKLKTDMSKISKQKYNKNGVLNIQQNMIQLENQQKYLDTSNKLSQIMLSMDNYKMMGNKHFQVQLSLPNISMTIPVKQAVAKSNFKRERKLYSQNGKSTKNQRYDNHGFASEIGIYKTAQARRISLRGDPLLGNAVFPVINRNSSKNQSSEKIVLPQHMAAKKRNKVKGLINIETLIRQKQQLYNSKLKAHKPQFSFYDLDERHSKLINQSKSLEKKRSLENKSPVHSKHFMRNLIKESLRKSGYVSQKALDNLKTNISLQQISKQKIFKNIYMNQLSKQQSCQYQSYLEQQHPEKHQQMLSSLQRMSLVSNDFDQFFHRI